METVLSYDQSLHLPNLLCYGKLYNLLDNFLLRDLDLLLIDNPIDDKHNTLPEFLYSHLYGSLHKLLMYELLLMETVLSYDQSLHLPNLLYYDKPYNLLDNFLLRDLDLLLIDNPIDDKHNILMVCQYNHLLSLIHISEPTRPY